MNAYRVHMGRAFIDTPLGAATLQGGIIPVE